MSRIFDFNKRFGKDVDLDQVGKNFLNKVNYFLIEPLDKKIGLRYSDHNKKLFDFVAIELNHNPSDLIRHDRDGYTSWRPSFSIFLTNFESALLLVEVIYDYFNRFEEYDRSDWLGKIDETVKLALIQPLSLGVSWSDGKFYPEGAQEFEERLVSDVLKWLESKPKVQALYKNALDNHSQSLSNPIKRKDVIGNAFQAVEKLCQEFLESPKPSFDNNFNSLVDKLEIDKEWKKIFNSYRELSKEFGRHAGDGNNFIPSKEDTEAFLYLSGLIMRLILQKIAE